MVMCPICSCSVLLLGSSSSRKRATRAAAEAWLLDVFPLTPFAIQLLSRRRFLLKATRKPEAMGTAVAHTRAMLSWITTSSSKGAAA